MTNRTTGELAEANPLSGGELLHIVQDGVSRRLVSRRLLTEVGMWGFFATETPPYGWLKCNGAAISRAVYPELFAAIGTRFGAGDGTSTFNLPDARGEFLRGWDDGRGVDAGRTLGSWQASQNLAHVHGINDPGHSHVYQGFNGSVIIATAPGIGFGAANTNVSLTGISILSSGGSEARSRNLAVLICIKF